jgi:replicative DNA helicase
MVLNKLSQYGVGFQIKVVASLLTDKVFLLSVRDVVVPELFDSQAQQWIVENALKYFDKYHTYVTLDVLQVEVKKVQNEVLRTSIVEQLREAYKASMEDNKYVQEEFSAFCKNQELKAALMSSVDMLAAGDYDSIRSTIERALKAGMDKNIGHEYLKDVESRYREDYRPTIPTPWPEINNLTQGGFGPGDLAIVFGNPGGGKSWMMVALAGHAVQLGYNVIYYTLELGEQYVGKRFDCYFTGYDIDQVNSHRAEVEETIKKLPGKLIVKEYPPKSASVTTIKSHIQKATDTGTKPDFIVIDYVDYLKPPSRKYAEKKDEIDDVYVATKGLAKELQIPIATPSQVNRAGSKDDVIEGDKAAGSYDKIMVADFCLSLSRKKEDKVEGTGRVHVMKNRYGMDGMTYNAAVNTNNGHIEISNEIKITSIPKVATSVPGVDSIDRALLSKKFFEMSTQKQG